MAATTATAVVACQASPFLTQVPAPCVAAAWPPPESPASTAILTRAPAPQVAAAQAAPKVAAAQPAPPVLGGETAAAWVTAKIGMLGQMQIPELVLLLRSSPFLRAPAEGRRLADATIQVWLGRSKSMLSACTHLLYG